LPGAGFIHITSTSGINQLKKENCKKIRTKTSIRYAKENDREKRERRRKRERKVEGEI
jgi:hypothetical protein